MGKLGTALRERAQKLKQELTAIWYAYQDPRSGWWPKAIIGLTIAYALSPIDLIPDFIPILGQLDDLIIVPALLALAIRLLPAEVMADARQRAIAEPLRLARRWSTAIVFGLLWAVALFLLGWWIANLVFGR